MPTVIDSLVVTLGLDITKFRQGQKQNQEDLKKTKEDANATAKAIEASGKIAAQFFTRLRNEALLLFAAFTGANSLKQFAENITTTDANMSRLAKQLDMSTEDLTAWTNAAERMGGSTEATAGTFQGLEDQVQQLATTGKSSLVPFFASMGIGMLDANNRARPLKDILLDIAHWAEGKDPAMVSQRLRSMGFDQGTINLLLKGRQAVEGLIEQSRQLGVTSDAEGQRAQALQEKWRALEQAATSLGRTILNDLSPPIIAIMGQMVQWAQANREWIDTKINEAIQVVITKAQELYQYLATVDWASVWQVLIEWITQVQLQFQTWFDYLKQHWPEIKQSVSDFADAVERIVVVINKVIEATTGWQKAIEILFIAWAVSKFVPIIGVFASILGLVNGISAGILGMTGRLALLSLRMAPFAAMLAATSFAGGEDQEFSDQKNQEFIKNRGGASPLVRWLRRALPGWLGGLGLTSLTQDESMSGAQQAFLDTLAGPESGGDYTIKEGGSHFDDFSRFPEGVGPGGTSTAAGRYQFTSGTWHDVANKKGLGDFSPESQDKGAWYLAATRYHEKTGGDLETDVKAGKYAEIAAALKEIWPSLPGGSQSRQSMDQFIGRFSKNLNTLGEKTQPRAAGDPSKPTPVPRSPVADLSTGAKAAPSVQNSTSQTTNTTTSDVSVGQITINTQATDVIGISRGLVGALRNSMTIQQANTGLN